MLCELGLYGMATAFQPFEGQSQARSVEHTEWLAMLLEREITMRRQKRFEAYVRAAKLDLVFSASTGSGGTTDKEVWTTDGTAAGTYMINEIYPGSTISSPLLLTLGCEDDYGAIALSGNAVKQDAT